MVNIDSWFKHYDYLSNVDKKIYNCLLKAIKNRDKEVVVPLTNSENHFHILTAIKYDHPLLFYVDYSKYRRGVLSNEEVIELKYVYSAEQTKKLMKVIRGKAEQIVNDVKKYDVVTRELMIHDWLIKNCNYNLEFEQEQVIHSIVGPLVYGECVCDGFSLAYKLLLNCVAIDCVVVCGLAGTGKASLNEEEDGHAWNVVDINGEKYFVDVTFDRLNNDKKFCSRSYFNLSDDECFFDHKLDDFIKIPPCKKSLSPVKTIYKAADLFAFLDSEYKKGAEYSELKLKQGFELNRFSKFIDEYTKPTDVWRYHIKTYWHGEYSNSIFIEWRN